MKVTIFTGNALRHLSLIKHIASVVKELYVVMEITPVFAQSSLEGIKKDYFSKVSETEKIIFGNYCFLPTNVKLISIPKGEVNSIPIKILDDALNSEQIIVFGSSIIKGELCQELVLKNAINIHMGLSPYYRGSGCNFWAVYDKKPELVGATVHKITKSVDVGEILFQSIPKSSHCSTFYFTMDAVKEVILDLQHYIKYKRKLSFCSYNSRKEIRYCVNKDFSEKIIEKFYSNSLDFITTIQREPSLYYNLYERNI